MRAYVRLGAALVLVSCNGTADQERVPSEMCGPTIELEHKDIPGSNATELKNGLVARGYDEFYLGGVGHDQVSWMFSRKEDSTEINVEVGSGEHGNGVQWLRSSVTWSGPDSATKESLEHLALVAGMTYDGNDPARAAQWTREHIHTNGAEVQIGNAAFRIRASEGYRGLWIDPLFSTP